MGYIQVTTNPNKAMNLAQEIVTKQLDWPDIEALIGEAMKHPEEWDALFTAINSNWPEKKQQMDEIEDEIIDLGERARELAHIYSNLIIDNYATRQTAFFMLGYAAALRLLNLGWLAGTPKEAQS